MAGEYSKAGTYTGNGSSVSVTEIGFSPSYLKIWPDMSGSKEVIMADDTEEKVYLKVSDQGEAYLCADIAASVVVSLDNGATVKVVKDASASSGGFEVTLKPEITMTNIDNPDYDPEQEVDPDTNPTSIDVAIYSGAMSLRADNSAYSADAFVKCQNGSLLKIQNDADASDYPSLRCKDDGEFQFDQGALQDQIANDTPPDFYITSEEDGWRGSYEIVADSDEVTLDERGFTVSDSETKNANDTTYKYLAVR